MVKLRIGKHAPVVILATLVPTVRHLNSVQPLQIPLMMAERGCFTASTEVQLGVQQVLARARRVI